MEACSVVAEHGDKCLFDQIGEVLVAPAYIDPSVVGARDVLPPSAFSSSTAAVPAHGAAQLVADGLAEERSPSTRLIWTHKPGPGPNERRALHRGLRRPAPPLRG